MTIIDQDAPSALHRSQHDLPFVDIGPSGLLQLLQVDLANGVWVVRNRFPRRPAPPSRRTGTRATCTPSPRAAAGTTSRAPRR
jgi:hypothetical protein